MKTKQNFRWSSISPVSKKRLKDNIEYKKRKALYLDKYPFCQVALDELGLSKDDVRSYGVVMNENHALFGHYIKVPLACDIHHMKKPRSKYLNDESTWMGVCRANHKRIENNKSWAREMGYLDSI